eukprot:15341097-Ditylum_brightwellii.AAC.1
MYEYASIVIPLTPRLKAYIGLTGCFLHKSSRENEYLYILYDFDANAILYEPIPNRQAKTLVDAWTRIHKKVSQHGHPTKHYVLDNEISEEFKAALVKYSKTFELIPLNIHCHNAAEQASCTYKNHLLASLATCNPKFPVTEWNRLTPQATLTLNLLCTSRVNPKLSAHAYLFGNFNFSATPLVPPDTKVFVRNKPNNCGSWAYHGAEGWAICPSPKHYHCIRCFMPDTAAEVDADTVKLIPHVILVPSFTDKEAIQQAIADIIYILKKPPKNIIPVDLKGDPIVQAFAQIAT